MTVKQFRHHINTSRAVTGLLGGLIALGAFGGKSLVHGVLTVHSTTVDIPEQVKANTDSLAAFKAQVNARFSGSDSQMTHISFTVDSMVHMMTISKCIAVHQIRNLDAQECVK